MAGHAAIQRLCFGGSFNPIHHGHLICARAVAEAKGFDRVVLIPSALPPHKLQVAELAAPHHRLAMCRLAIEGEKLFEVDDVELTRPGPSYTIDTVRQLRRRGWDKVVWLIGADMVSSLPKWHEPEALLKEVEFVLVNRPGCTINWQGLPTEYRQLRAKLVNAPAIDISASSVRSRVRSGESIRYLAPEPLIEYISRHALYR